VSATLPLHQSMAQRCYASSVKVEITTARPTIPKSKRADAQHF
jgi:hypothetical protein